MADAVQSWSIDNILKKHLLHRGSVDEDDQIWDEKKDWISNIPAKKWPADPAECLSNARHEFGEHDGVNMSIEASATFTVMEPDTMRTMIAGEFKPTVLNLGRQMAALEGTEASYCTASGMSAISAVILQLCPSGSHIVASRCLYGGIHPLLSRLMQRSAGIKTSFVDINDMEAVRAAVREGETRLIYAQTMSNPTLTVADIPGLSAVAREKGLMLVVDNMFTPMVVSPARLGADVVVHSVSKFISGGADIIADCRRVSEDKNLQLLIAGKSDREEEEEEEPKGVKEEEESTQLDIIEVSLNPMSDLTFYPTMKMEGYVMGRTVVALIDSGSTHNFVACKLVQELGVRVDQLNGIEVTHTSGQREQCSGICRGLTLSLQGIDITQDFLVELLEITDIILGMQWLETLGETKVNWKTLHFEYGQGEQRIVLRGDPNLVTSRFSTVTS